MLHWQHPESSDSSSTSLQARALLQLSSLISVNEAVRRVLVQKIENHENRKIIHAH